MTTPPVKAIVVIGSGTMGSGVAQLAAVSGCTVHLIDVNAIVLRRGLDAIKKNLGRAVDKGRMTADERDAATARIQTPEEVGVLSDVELAIEAVAEDLAIKQRVFRDSAFSSHGRHRGKFVEFERGKVVFLLVGPEEDQTFYLGVGKETALQPFGFIGFGRHIKHVAAPEQFFGTDAVQDSS